MDYEELFPGRFVKAADLKGREVTLTIASVRAEKIDDKMKAVMSFEGAGKELVLNRTNAEAVKLMFGREVNSWCGRQLTIYPATIKDPFADGEILALRVKGSPEISKPMQAEVKRGRKTLRVSVVPTGKGAPPKQQAAKTKAPPPPIDEAEAAEILARENSAAAEPGSGG
jgi:hypothetical protein